MTLFLAVLSGKGGTGKTTTALNLAYTLISLGKKVILLEANLATPDLALHLGLTSPPATLNDFLKKKKSLAEVILSHPSGLSFIVPSVRELKEIQPEKLTEVFEHLDQLADIVLVDCPAGLGLEVRHILKNTDETLVVVNPSLGSVANAIKSIELAHEHNNSLPGFVLNMTSNKNELKPREIETALNLPLIANIPYDQKIKKALYQRAPAPYLYPRAKSSQEYLKLANVLLR